MANLNVNERKRLIFPSFGLFMEKKREEIKQNNILTKMKLSPFTNYFQKIKELLDLIICKISSDGGDFDFPHIIEIGLLCFCFFLYS